MMSKTTLILIAAFAMMLCLVPLNDQSDADIRTMSHGVVTISGDVTLTEDRTFDDGSTITVAVGTKLDISTYTMDFGAGSNVIFLGKTTIISQYGKIVMGEGSSFILVGAVLPGMPDKVTYTFDGTVTVDNTGIMGSGATVAFVPDTDDHAICVSWKTTDMHINDPKFTYKYSANSSSNTGTTTEIVSFSTADIVETSYDDGKMISVNTIKVVAYDTETTMETTVTTNGAVNSKMRFSEIKSTTHYEDSDVTSMLHITGMGITTIAGNSDFIATLDSSAINILIERTTAGTTDSKTTFTTTTLNAELDLTEVQKLLFPDEGEGVDIIRYMEFTARTGTIEKASSDKVTSITDLTLTIDGRDTATNFLTLEFTEDNVVNTVVAGKADVTSMAITRSLVLDLDAAIPYVKIDRTREGSCIQHIDVEELAIFTDNLDVMSLYTIYSKEGKLTIQQLLDYSEKLSVSASTLREDSDGDGRTDTTALGLGAVLEVDTRGKNTATVYFDELTTQAEYGASMADVHVDKTEIYMESEGSLSDCLDAFTKGIHFTDDAHSEFQLYNAGFVVIYPDEKGSYTIQSTKSSDSSPKYASLTMSIDYSKYLSETTIKGNVSAVGYTFILQREASYTDPEGTASVDFRTTDLSGAFSMAFKDGMSFSANLYMPWILDVTYYDIVFRIIGDDASLTLTHGNLAIDGYDYANEGILAMLDKMAHNDFSLDTRVSLTATDMEVYKDSHEVALNSFSDVELEIRNVSVVLKREDSLKASLERTRLSLAYEDGSELDRELKHLDVVRDLSGAEPEPSFIEKNAMYLLIAFSSISSVLVIVLIYLRIKKPEMLQLTEGQE